MLYDEDTIECMRQAIREAEHEVYSALTLAQEEPGDAKLENRLDSIHSNLLDVLDMLELELQQL